MCVCVVAEDREQIYEYDGSDEEDEDVCAANREGRRPSSDRPVGQNMQIDYRSPPDKSAAAAARFRGVGGGGDLVPPTPPITSGLNFRPSPVAAPTGISAAAARLPPARMPPRQHDPRAAMPAKPAKVTTTRTAEGESATIAPNDQRENTLRQNFARLQVTGVGGVGCGDNWLPGFMLYLL